MESYYVVGKFSSHAGFVPPEEYGLVRDNIVRTCVDVLIMRDDCAVLLGKRNIEPWPYWFTFGGAMRPGERPSQSAARIIMRDIGLKIFAERFIKLGEVDLVFARRREPPQENGCHDHNIFHLLVLNKEEVSLPIPEKNEYDEIKWWEIKEITIENGFHPVTIDMIMEAIKILKN